MDVREFLSLLSTGELWLARSNMKDKREGSFSKEMKEELNKIYESFEKEIGSNDSIKSDSDYRTEKIYSCFYNKNIYDNMVIGRFMGNLWL